MADGKGSVMVDRRFMDSLGAGSSEGPREAQAADLAPERAPLPTRDGWAVMTRLHVAMAALPTTSERIGIFLSLRDCRTPQGTGDNNPLSVWVSEVCGYPVTVGSVWTHAENADWSFEVKTPGEWLAFLADFDCGRYPLLVDDGEPSGSRARWTDTAHNLLAELERIGNESLARRYEQGE